MQKQLCWFNHHHQKAWPISGEQHQASNTAALCSAGAATIQYFLQQAAVNLPDLSVVAAKVGQRHV
jgi:hypothetical protein